MIETEASLRDRALAAWQERRQEMQVEKERREADKKLRVVQGATAWVLRVLADGGEAPTSVDAMQDLARHFGLVATEPVGSDWGWATDVTVDHITFRYTEPYSSDIRFELIAECPDCGADVHFGHQIKNLTSLGIALDEQEKNPKGMHRCPEPERDLAADDESMPEVAATVVEPDPFPDPAHVLLDALQGYIHAAIDARVDRHPVRWATGVPENKEDTF